MRIETDVSEVFKEVGSYGKNNATAINGQWGTVNRIHTIVTTDLQFVITTDLKSLTNHSYNKYCISHHRLNKIGCIILVKRTSKISNASFSKNQNKKWLIYIITIKRVSIQQPINEYFINR
jgi:hypothetical protein